MSERANVRQKWKRLIRRYLSYLIDGPFAARILTWGLLQPATS
ncbi:MAG TPA: hypothetical protein VES88_12580 [Gemmatimonadaceae bacterium]|nr:hypothetical protein [Gemmatimonadaceae bacterium]